MGLESSHHSSAKFVGTSPNVFKIVAAPKFPVFGSPLRLNASAPALAGSRDIASARRIDLGSTSEPMPNDGPNRNKH